MADNDFKVDPDEYNGQDLNQTSGDLHGYDPTLTDENQTDDQLNPNTILTENDGNDVDQESFNDQDENDHDIDYANKSSKSGSTQLVEYQPSRDDDDDDDDDDIIDEDEIDDQSEMIVLDPDHVS